jgi:uncharacterized protein
VTERPRDALGRPLPADADPRLVVPGVPDIAGITGEECWALACDYLGRGLPFHAHEVFELRWRAAPPEERVAWQALAQWGAALTHEARGNPEGARRLAARALAGLAQAKVVPECVDLPRVRRSCEHLSAGGG